VLFSKFFSLKMVSDSPDYDVFKALLLEYAARDLDDSKNSSIWQDLTQLPQRYGAPDGAALLAHRGDALAGCGAFAATARPGVAEIKRIYVRSDFRRQGLARALTQALVAQAKECGYHTAAISTWPHNTQALALYRQLGFAPIAPFKEHTHAQLVFLGLALGPAQQNTKPTSAFASQ
jgi:putative acetyltransferase